MADPFPEDVRRFLLDNINSVEQLEALLLLRGQPGRAWDADALSRALYTSPAAAELRLADLVTRGLLKRAEGSERYIYQPADAGQDSVISRLHELYRERRVTVISLIYSRPSDQVRAFADAFKLRKDK